MVRQNPFDQKKASILANIDSEKPDFSPKGDIDVLCMPIIDLINSHQDMVTTSSCSGRISIFVEGTKLHKGQIKTGGKGEGGRWLFVTHNSQDVPNWMDKIDVDNIKVSEVSTNLLNEDTRFVLYKFEPFILHVKCRDFNTASRLFNTAMACGFRESGIGSNNLVAIRINIKLDTPIGYYDQETDAIKLYVSRQYINILDNLSLFKFKENTSKMEALHDRIKNQLF